MHFTDTITIYNYYRNPTTKAESWQRTVISNVQFSQNAIKSVSGDNKVVIAKTSNITLTGIAKSSREYINPIEYAKLTDTTGHYTFDFINNKDYVVRGEVTQEISSGYPITSLKKDYQFVGIVAEVSDHRLS